MHKKSFALAPETMVIIIIGIIGLLIVLFGFPGISDGFFRESSKIANLP